MNEEVPKNWGSGQCPDELTLQLYVEGETDAPAAELIFHHLAQCSACAARLGQMREVKRFCLEQLGEEDLREAEFTRHVLQTVKAQLPSIFPPAPMQATQRFRLWQRFAVAAALVLIATIGAVWFLAEQRPGLSAKAVLEEAEMRERLWEFQPGKVLHWVIETDVINSEKLPDGHYRTLHWRSNVPGQAATLLRKYNAQNQLIFARWIKPDGAQIVYRQTKDEAVGTIYPALATMRAALQDAPPEQRVELEKVFALAHDANDFTVQAEAFAKDARQALEQGRLQIVDLSTAGRVFRIRRDNTVTAKDGQALRFEHEHYLSVETFRQARLFTRRSFADGRVATEDSRWTVFRESSPEEFAAQELTALLAQTKKVETVSAKTRLQQLLSLRRPSRPTHQPTGEK